MKDISYFSILLFLFMFTYTLLGMEMFAYKVKLDDDGQCDMVNGTWPRANFNNFLFGITTVFIVIIGEDWNNVMVMYWKCTNLSSVLYFVSLLILGNWIMLNLFLAILLQNFESGDDEPEPEKPTKNKYVEKAEQFIKKIKDKIG